MNYFDNKTLTKQPNPHEMSGVMQLCILLNSN